MLCTDTLQLLCDASPICMAALDSKVSTGDSPTEVDCWVFVVRCGQIFKIVTEVHENPTRDPQGSLLQPRPDAAWPRPHCSAIKSTLTSCPGCARLSVRLHYNKNMLDESAALSAAPARVTRHTDATPSPPLIKL